MLLFVYLMMMANPAPSSIPSPLLHLNRDPRIHLFVALRIVEHSRVWTHPMTSLCDFCHLLDSLSAILVIKTFASLSSCPSTVSTKGENDACLACAASSYFLFFSFSADANTAFTDSWACDWASVSMTRMSNNLRLPLSSHF